MSRLVPAKVTFFFVFLAVLDVAVLPVFQVRSVSPSFLLLFICYAAFEWGSQRTVYIAFGAGILRDLLGGGLIGAEATLLVVLAPALDFLVQKMERQLPGIYFMLVFLYVFFAGVLRFLAGHLAGLPAGLIGEHLGSIVLTALYTSACLPVFNILANRWFGRASSIKQYELFR